jgi:CDP-glucose 4,6-dehydratase
MDVAAGFWRDRSVLLTGHTGFKGAWMSLWLRALGADVTGYALAPLTDPSLWTLAGAARPGLRDVRGDIRDASRFAEVLEEADPQVIVHMAA